MRAQVLLKPVMTFVRNWNDTDFPMADNAATEAPSSSVPQRSFVDELMSDIMREPGTDLSTTLPLSMDRLEVGVFADWVLDDGGGEAADDMNKGAAQHKEKVAQRGREAIFVVRSTQSGNCISHAKMTIK